MVKRNSVFVRAFVTFGALATLAACGNSGSSSVDNDELGQQIGDSMASVDEAGGNGGTLADNSFERGARRSFARLSPGGSWVDALLMPRAEAIGCGIGNTFGSCSGTSLARTFNSCTLAGATFSGSVEFTWGGAATTCALSAAGDTITRVPNFTVTGRRSGATLAVTKTGTIGQRLTWVSGSGNSKVFSFSNDGIRRVFTNSSGKALLDYTTTTTSDLTVTGPNRAGRTLTGGAIRVTNNLNGVTCDYTPDSVTWVSSCNCPTSGRWTGTCSDGKSTTLTITGCGNASLAVGSDSSSVAFDRCYGI